MGANRKRTETLTLRFTKSEKSEIVRQAVKAKMSLTEYIIALSKQTDIVLPPDVSPIILELKRIGNNINQIAAKVNSGVAYVPDLTAVVENQRLVYGMLCKLIEDSKWQR